MRNQKNLVNTMTIIFVLLLPLVLLLTSVQMSAFDRSYYQREFMKYNVPQSIGMNMPDLMDSADKLLKYLENKRADINFKVLINGTQQEFFSDRDKIHMVDVKNLFLQGRLLRNIFAAYLILYLLFIFIFTRNKGKRLAKAAIASFVIGVIPIILLIILMNLDFYKYFTIFHQIFFNNDFWLLDPARDRLVNIYPEDFFSDIAFRIAYYYLIALCALLLGGIGYLWSSRKKSISKKL